MTIVRVQEADNGQNGVTSLAATFGSAATTGNCVLVGVGSSAPSNFATSVTDTVSNTYTLVSGTHSTNSANYIAEFWVAKNITGGFTQVTVNYNSGGGTQVLFIIEYSGVSPTAPTGVTGTTNNQGPGNPLSPSLTVSSSTSALVAMCTMHDNVPSSVNAPWGNFHAESVWGTADYVPGSTGTFQATFNPSETTTWGSSAVELLTTPPLTLTLTDSVSFSDATSIEDEITLTDSLTLSDVVGVARGQAVSDSMTVNDSFPNSFSVQSSAMVPNTIPAVEVLTNSVIPAEVKTFYEFE
jgi:hypothetical protein